MKEKGRDSYLMLKRGTKIRESELGSMRILNFTDFAKVTRREEEEEEEEGSAREDRGSTKKKR